uniref:Ricin B lectin domain-containing protein n=4 Tax=Aegilops tauschii subsp. strangulata TaxID=200361 RepID=A0A453SPJ1_AEGTS
TRSTNASSLFFIRAPTVMAAAAGLVWATLLMCVALGAAQTELTSFQRLLLANFFPQGSVPSPVRIYCRQDAALNVAIVGGKVVLANAKCSDWSQKWYVVYTDSTLFNGKFELKPFSLVNAQTLQVITVTIPSGSSQKVELYSPPSSPWELQRLQNWLQNAREELWTPEQPKSPEPTRTEGFYRLFATKNNEKTAFHLNGLGGGVKVGTEVGIYSGASNTENALWQLTSDTALCAP